MKEEIAVSQCPRMLNPGPVVLVTSTLKGQPNIMTAAWSMALSFNPTMVGVSIAPRRLTHEFIQKSEEFVLNVPTLRIMKQVHYCGSVSGRNVDKFKESGLIPITPREVRAPLVEQCLAHIECALVNAITIGDHTLFVGQVLSVQVEKDTFDNAWLLKEEEAKPLHNLGGRLYAVLDKPLSA
ncbi:MAG: flavin reductase family protein [Chloroflexi bacterium]|nr:flavin reductase family protein [Chloroflexota bacterium]